MKKILIQIFFCQNAGIGCAIINTVAFEMIKGQKNSNNIFKADN
jgi:hypothetical protein